ncbi:uncharacterized protein LOC134786378 [Penaeus indicus]|uniref:uncharacterized protein LOC134786378 n=1 Tax=Penaeus indicus TaxID=29960 RepID=UPI00300C3334
MHPKSLISICIDHIVSATIAYTQSHAPEVAWPDVSQLWATLWRLPLQLPLRASRLLHAHLTYDLSDATLPLMTLLAAEARRISLRPTDRQLASAGFSGVRLKFIKLVSRHELRELDITGVDLGLDTTLLESLLPRCPSLCALKLGGNTSPSVLRAARTCPVQVLHVSERLVWNPRVSEPDLMEIFFGLTDVQADQMLQNVKDGKPLNLKPSWPLLKDLCVGFCRVRCEFLFLVLTVFQNLDKISSKLVPSQRVLDMYLSYMHSSPGIPKLKLKSCTVVSGEFARVAVAVPDLEELTLIPRGGSDHSTAEDLKALTTLPSFKVLRLHNLRHFGQGDLSIISDSLKLIGPKLVNLELQGGKVSETCIGYLTLVLQKCPNLQRLCLDSNCGFSATHSEPLKVGCLKNLKSFKCRAPLFDHTTLISMFHWFPNLQNLTLAGRVNGFEEVFKNLVLLPDLRVLKVTVKQQLPIQDICEVPGSIRHSNCEFHVPSACLTEEDISKIQFSGWTFVPISEYNSW